MKRRVDVWYARPESMYGYEIDIPDELLAEDADPDELYDWVMDNVPFAEVWPEEWDFS